MNHFPLLYICIFCWWEFESQLGSAENLCSYFWRLR